MSDLIRRDEVIEALKLLTDEGDLYDEGYNLGLNTAILEVKKRIPTAEPKVGKWKLNKRDVAGEGFFICSCCGYDAYDATDYCPNCGSYNGDKNGKL